MDGGEVGWLEKVVVGEGGGWRRWWVPLSQYTGSSVKISMKTNEPFHHTILLCTKGTGCRGGAGAEATTPIIVNMLMQQ